MRRVSPSSASRKALVALLAVLGPGVASADTIFVPDDQPTIQAAIDAAVVGDTVLVRPGTYLETLDFGGKDVVVRSTDGYPHTTIDALQTGTVVLFENGETSAAVLDGFTVAGGLAVARPTGGIYCENADPTIRRCLLTGNRGEDGVGGAGALQCVSASPDIRNCVFRRNIGGTPFVGPFPGSVSYGGPGAIRAAAGSFPTIVSTVFEDNRGAHKMVGSGAAGAGVAFAETDSHPVFNNCEFYRNVGGDHADVFFAAGSGVITLGSGATFRECWFEANRAGHARRAGGVAALLGGLVFMTDCTFVENVGPRFTPSPYVRDTGAGAIYGSLTTLQVTRCEFRGNRGSSPGAPGAVYVTGVGATEIRDSSFVDNVGGDGGLGAPGAVRFDETPHMPSRIERCTFEGNVGGAGETGGAGALRAEDTGLIVDCVFVGNQGGAGTRGIGGPGAVRCDRTSVASFDSNVLVGNVGGAGSHDTDDDPDAAHGGPGGILFLGGTTRFRNGVVADNTGASSSDYAGGAGGVDVDIVLGNVSPSLVNCTVVGNVAGTGPGAGAPSGLRFAGSPAPRVANSVLWNDAGAPEVSGSPLLRYSIVRGGHTGAGNLDVDPLLVDPDGGDFHLSCVSPARDAGDGTASLPPLDFEGDPRVVGAGVDIGADEYALPPAGSSYCVATPNSTGTAALIDASGCNALSDGFLPLRAGPVPNTLGAFFYGPSPLQVPFGNGFRCVGGRVYRLPFVTIPGGELVHRFDYASPPQPSGQVTAGSTWYFQAYYRDPAASGAPFDLSDGLQVTFAE